jgi:hypothetical protein
MRRRRRWHGNKRSGGRRRTRGRGGGRRSPSRNAKGKRPPRAWRATGAERGGAGEVVDSTGIFMRFGAARATGCRVPRRPGGSGSRREECGVKRKRPTRGEQEREHNWLGEHRGFSRGNLWMLMTRRPPTYSRIVPLGSVIFLFFSLLSF